MKRILKGIYSRLPFKKQLFVFVKHFFKFPRSVYQHLHFKGEILVKARNREGFKTYHYGHYVENEIFWNGLYGGWEKDSLRIWSELCEAADVIFDIGANTGIYSLLAKTINNHSEVHAFEPIPHIFKKLRKNIDLNNFSISANKFALSDCTAEAVIYDTVGEHSYCASLNEDFTGDHQCLKKISVQTQRLDDYIVEKGITKIDLMKIDVESYEAEVLSGMGIYLEKFRPAIIIEILNEDVAAKIEKLFKNFNYYYFNLDEQGHFEQRHSLGKSSFHNFLICNKENAKKYLSECNRS